MRRDVVKYSQIMFVDMRAQLEICGEMRKASSISAKGIDREM